MASRYPKTLIRRQINAHRKGKLVPIRCRICKRMFTPRRSNQINCHKPTPNLASEEG